MKFITALLICLGCNAAQQQVVNNSMDAIDKALATMECNAAVLRVSNQAIIDLCPVPKERTTCPAMEQILADLAVGLEQCKEGL
jgi:hypothetical protein